MGSACVLVQKNNGGINISNNYCNITERDINKYETHDYYSIPSAFSIGYEFKGFLSDGSEDTTNISNILSLQNSNISILNNVFGSGVNCYLRDQNTTNLTHDLSNYNFKDVRLVSWLYPSDRYYLKPGAVFDSTSTQNYTGYESPRKGLYSTYWIKFQFNASADWYQNMNDTLIGNVTFISPKSPLIGLQGIIESDRVNHSLPPASIWYQTATNFSIDVPSGEQYLVNATVKNSTYTAFTISNLTAAGQVNISDGSHTPGSVWSLYDGGVFVSSYTTGADGYTNFSWNTWSLHNLSLIPYVPATPTTTLQGNGGDHGTIATNPTTTLTYSTTSSTLQGPLPPIGGLDLEAAGDAWQQITASVVSLWDLLVSWVVDLISMGFTL
jgi:hypothetical protein